MIHRIVCFIVAALGSAPLIAADRNVEDQETLLFRTLDTNHDGYLSRLEAAGSSDLSPRFASLDKDGDRRLSPDEFKPYSDPEHIEIPLPAESSAFGVKPAIQIKPVRPLTGGLPGLTP